MLFIWHVGTVEDAGPYTWICFVCQTTTYRTRHTIDSTWLHLGNRSAARAFFTW